MFGVGSSEIFIIGIFVLLLFGPTLLAFWLGFNMGRKSTPADKGEPATPAAPTARAHDEPSPPDDERKADE